MEHNPKSNPNSNPNSMDASAKPPKSSQKSPTEPLVSGTDVDGLRDTSAAKAIKPAKPTKRATGRAQSSKAAEPKAETKIEPKLEITDSKIKLSAKAPNRVRVARIERMMSKAELARRAGLSVLTIDRIEKGLGCRMDTKRKILEALGLNLADRVRVFGEEE